MWLPKFANSEKYYINCALLPRKGYNILKPIEICPILGVFGHLIGQNNVQNGLKIMKNEGGAYTDRTTSKANNANNVAKMD